MLLRSTPARAQYTKVAMRQSLQFEASRTPFHCHPKILLGRRAPAARHPSAGDDRTIWPRSMGLPHRGHWNSLSLRKGTPVVYPFADDIRAVRPRPLRAVDAGACGCAEEVLYVAEKGDAWQGWIAIGAVVLIIGFIAVQLWPDPEPKPLDLRPPSLVAYVSPEEDLVAVSQRVVNAEDTSSVLRSRELGLAGVFVAYQAHAFCITTVEGQDAAERERLRSFVAATPGVQRVETGALPDECADVRSD